jgi:FO synthase
MLKSEAIASDVERVLDFAQSGGILSRDDALILMNADTSQTTGLLNSAASLRNRFKKQISFSKKVFLPLTNLCRDYCGYCTFRRDPGDPGAKTLTLQEVMAVVSAGEALGCKEALFSLGDKPELAFAEMRTTLTKLGHSSTISYLRKMCEEVLNESSLLPHVNPGVMTERDLSDLKEVSVSMGLMLENVSPRLLKKGGPHFGAPDKHPLLRLQTIEAAGRLNIPFTTGILIGIGETLTERVDSLIAIRDLHHQYGHIQEIIIQNFRSKPEIPMHNQLDPTLEDHVRTIAVARLLFGGEMNIQAPPNLALEEMADETNGGGPDFEPLQDLIKAGINDWGGVSPLTKDFINPEKPWPHIDMLRRETERGGFKLRERLAIYPEYVQADNFISPSLASRVDGRVDGDGYPN